MRVPNNYSSPDWAVPDPLRTHVIYHVVHNHPVWDPVLDMILAVEAEPDSWDTSTIRTIEASAPMLKQIKALEGEPLNQAANRHYQRDHPHRQAVDLYDIYRALIAWVGRAPTSGIGSDILTLLVALSGELKRLIAELAEHDTRGTHTTPPSA